MLSHKINSSEFSKFEIIPSIFSNHNSMKLENNCKKKKTVKNKNMWRLNKMLLKNQWTTHEIKKKKIHRDKWKQKHDYPKHMGCIKNTFRMWYLVLSETFIKHSVHTKRSWKFGPTQKTYKYIWSKPNGFG